MTDDKIDEESADAIFAAAIKIRDSLGELDLAIDGEVKEILRAAARAKRPLSAADEARRDALDADQSKLRQALDELSFATLARLDNSADVVELQGKLKTINANLTGELARLKKIERYSAIAAQVADGLAQLAIKAAGALA